MIGPACLPSVASDLLLTLSGVHYHLPARRRDFTTVLKIRIRSVVNQRLAPPIRPNPGRSQQPDARERTVAVTHCNQRGANRPSM